jgi:hypothetical protein
MREEHILAIEQLARATIERARVQPGQLRDGRGPNTAGFALITPGGHYPAFWIRDFSMSVDCGLIDSEEIHAHLRLVARHQAADRERRLASGAIIPAHAIPDHINLDDTAVFYPGSYSSGEDQGAPPNGPLPPVDDHFYFVHLAWVLWRTSRDAGFLEERILGRGMLERLDLAFHAVAADPLTGAVVTDEQRRAVGFGFQDSVHLIGEMSFATLLRWQAARELAELHAAMGGRAQADDYRRLADLIARSFVPVFLDGGTGDGWLIAATRVGRQPDVWATLFALHLGVLPRDAAERSRRTVADAVRAPGNTVEYQGAVRHVPSDRWARTDRCWDAGGTAAGTYQSGAFWHTPTGWLIEALQKTDPKLADEVGERYVRHLVDEDFRKGAGKGAPYECFKTAAGSGQNPVYVTSVTVPLAAIRGGHSHRDH